MPVNVNGTGSRQLISGKLRLGFLLTSSRQDCGSGPGVNRREQRIRSVWSRWAEDEEGDVSDRWSALQRVPDQADGHAQEHQPQLPAVYYPQPREEGETSSSRPGRQKMRARKNI